ncbi:MAG: CoA pyrophosphatase [Chloroflexi bacterium]|nr:CoA pyrophosphatase [Chloroflexota bacterium]
MRFAPRWPGGGTNPAYQNWRERNPRQGAVMLLIVPRESGPAVLLTERHRDLKHHGGELSLPGGSVDPADHDLCETALRETFEEIGIPRQAIELWGQLDGVYVPPSNFLVTPFTGQLLDASALRAHDPEVRAILEVPLATLLDPNAAKQQTDTEGRLIEYYDWNGLQVWGATARILNNLCEALGQPCPPEHLN